MNPKEKERYDSNSLRKYYFPEHKDRFNFTKRVAFKEFKTDNLQFESQFHPAAIYNVTDYCKTPKQGSFAIEKR